MLKENQYSDADTLEKEPAADKGPLRVTTTNKFIMVEELLSACYDLRLNIVSNEVECRVRGEEAFNPLNENNLYRWLRHQGISFTMNDLIAILKSEFVEKYDPLQEYFEGLGKHDGVDYINELAQYIHVVPKDRQRFDKHFKKMLVRVVACALMGDVFNKQAFILVSPQQNGGKTTFCRWLCPPALRAYYTENFNFDKDGQIALCENFLINLDELANLHKAEVNQLKSIFSKSSVKVRRPYARKQETSPRRCSFIGSTNRQDFLNDETGSVRWLCFEVEKIDFDYCKKINIDAVWRQAYHLFKADFVYELTQEDVEENEGANDAFQYSSPEMQLIQKNYVAATKANHQAFYTANDFVINLTKHAENTIKFNGVSVGRALHKLGFTREQKYNGTYNEKGYYINFLYADGTTAPF